MPTPLGHRRVGSALALLAAGSIAACLDRPIETIEPRTTSTNVEPITQSRIGKLDLLFAIDNSASMADKQAILAEAVPDLLRRLATPRCVDAAGRLSAGSIDADGECPAGQTPEFRPIADIHVGIVSSSLGDMTTGSCGMATGNDRGRLVSRAPGVETHQGRGFLAWQPGQPGSAASVDALEADLAEMVKYVDQTGCGFEMQLESVLRFLVDPEPYGEVVAAPGGRVEKQGKDEVVLRQRADFLRPDSLVAILMLSDENDCSHDPNSQGHEALAAPGFFRATDECAADPNDPCCTSCGLPNPPGCPPDPETCGPDQGTQKARRYDASEDLIDRRCFDQKRRYGVDLLYPTARYRNAFSQETIDPARADLAVVQGSKAVRNPLFASGQGGLPRPRDRVFFAPIVGVPWQAIAKRDAAGEPDLALGFMSVAELDERGLLAALVGDPDAHVSPTDPFMIEAFAPRSGTSQLLGAAPSVANDINGGDRPGGIKDLQYACTFALGTPDPTGSDCAACTGSCSHPLCDGTTQIAAKAYPGLRQLAVAAGLGQQGIIASICPEHSDPRRPDTYGYAPAVRTIIDRLKVSFQDACLPAPLSHFEDGSVQCVVIEARRSEGGGLCCADRGGRSPIDPASKTYNAVKLAEASPYNPGWDCFCEIEQLAGEERAACQTQSLTEGVDGFCYVDAESIPPIGDASLVPAHCPVGERRILRFVGEGEPQDGSVTFITCASSSDGQ